MQSKTSYTLKRAIRIQFTLMFTRVDLILLLMVIFWGANISVIKVALHNFNPIAFNCMRFILASVTLAVLYRHVFRDKLSRKDIVRLILLGILGNTIYQFFFVYGVQYTLASHVAILLATTPIFTAAISSWVGHEKIGPRHWFGIILSFGGVVLIVFGGKDVQLGNTRALIGDLLIVGASVIWSIYTVFSRPIVNAYSSWHYIVYTVGFGSLFLVPISIPAVLQQDWSAVGIYEWFAVAYGGLLGLVFGYSAWYYGVERIGSTRTSVYSNLTPVAGVTIGMIFLDERLTWLQWLGAAIIFAGIMINRFARQTCPPE